MQHVDNLEEKKYQRHEEMLICKTDIGRKARIIIKTFIIFQTQEMYRIYILADGMGGYNGGEIANKNGS